MSLGKPCRKLLRIIGLRFDWLDLPSYTSLIVFQKSFVRSNSRLLQGSRRSPIIEWARFIAHRRRPLTIIKRNQSLDYRGVEYCGVSPPVSPPILKVLVRGYTLGPSRGNIFPACAEYTINRHITTLWIWLSEEHLDMFCIGEDAYCIGY